MGALGRSATTVSLMARNEVLAVTEHEFLRLLEPVFLAGDRTMTDSMDPLSNVGIVTCLDPTAMADKKRQETTECLSSHQPRWFRDGRVSLVMRALDDAYRHADDDADNALNKIDHHSSTMAKLRQKFDESVKLGEEQRAKTLHLVVRATADTIADMLSIDAVGVSLAKTVADYVVDSLIAAELRNWFNLAFHANISLLDMLDAHTRIERLAGIVVDGALERENEMETNSA